VLGVALAIRLWNVVTHSYIVWPDETFQYLEPAHRLVFGSGVITWEFLDGIRSWFLPGILAGLIWLVSRVVPDPAAYVMAARLLCVAASMAIPFVGYRLAARRLGPAAGLLAGLLCALSSETVYFSPVIMTEPLATDAALLAIWFGDAPAPSSATRRRLLAAGLLFGLAVSLRWQYAPVLALAALAQHARRPRELALVAAAGLAVVVPVLGGLDAITWGVPFQSVWLNYVRNAAQGVSGAMGTEAWFFYPAYYFVAWGAAAGLLAICALIGMARAPVLAVLAVGTLALHSLAPHKELRFVFLATACMPILIGLGAAGLLRRISTLRPLRIGAPVAGAMALAVSAVTAVATVRQATPADAWHRTRSLLQATAVARDVPGACGLAIRRARVYETGGYTYWHRDAPIYFETWELSQTLENSAFRMRLDSVLDGRAVPQVPADALAAASDRYNVLVAPPGDRPAGFTEQACFGTGTKDDKAYCVSARPGGCR
jgi:hypothetical protein